MIRNTYTIQEIEQLIIISKCSFCLEQLDNESNASVYRGYSENLTACEGCKLKIEEILNCNEFYRSAQ